MYYNEKQPINSAHLENGEGNQLLGELITLATDYKSFAKSMGKYRRLDVLCSISIGEAKPDKAKPNPEPPGADSEYLGQQSIADYLEDLEVSGLSESHIRNSKRVLIKWWVFVNKSKETMAKANRLTWRNFTAHLLDRGLSKRTIGHQQSVIRNFYRWLSAEDKLPTNPFKGLQSPKADSRLPEYLTMDEARRLVEYPDTNSVLGMRDRAVLEMAYLTGLRLSELTNIRMPDINFEAGEIRVMGKGRKERIVLFNPNSEAINKYLAIARPDLLNGCQSEALFVTIYGLRLGKTGIGKTVRETGMAALDKHIHPHMLRHTFATHLLANGANLRVIQELLGHANLQSTAIYCHIAQPDLRRVYLAAHPLASKDGCSPH